MKGRTVLVVLFAALLLVLGFVFWIGATGGGTANVPKPDAAPAAPSATGSTGTGRPAEKNAGSEGAIAKTVHDRRVRDELRQRILAGWAAEGTDEQATAARAGRFVPRPNADGRGIDPKYIQEVVRGEFMPMARKCYEELLVRKPDAGGRLEMSFTIAADADLGGIVEDAEVAETSGLKDDKMTTCMRESLSTLAFPPPAHDGVVTVKYPIILSPDGEPDD